MSKLYILSNIGQSIWLDALSRSLIESGTLQKLIEQGLNGVTSNPTIFEKALSNSADYDPQLCELLINGRRDPQDLYEALAIQDIQGAADLLRPVYDATQKRDGYVSLEVNPHLAHDARQTAIEVQRLCVMVNRPNTMFKIPATSAGIDAIEHCISQGFNINVTLMFSKQQYDRVANAYLSGLEKLLEEGGNLAEVASVASFFISRVDTKVDERLDDLNLDELQGKIGIANAKDVYVRFREIFNSDRWQRLADAGAQVQRPLWASTSTKNPAYRDTLYVDELIGPDTVNTLPFDTLHTFLEQGQVADATVVGNHALAVDAIRTVEASGINLDQVGEELQVEGIQKFTRSYNEIIHVIEKRIREERNVWRQMDVDNDRLVVSNERITDDRGVSYTIEKWLI